MAMHRKPYKRRRRKVKKEREQEIDRFWGALGKVEQDWCCELGQCYGKDPETNQCSKMPID